MDAIKVLLKVKRYNPDTKESYHNVYSMFADNFTTVLDLLIKVKEMHDGSLAFNYGSRFGSDGSDAVNINGFPRLASMTNVSKLMSQYDKNEILIEPLANFPVIKDLIVDMSSFFQSYKEIIPYIVDKSKKKKITPVSNDQILEFGKVNECVMCGICHASCDIVKNDKNFIGPAIISRAYRFILDPRDNITKKRIKDSIKKGLWRCSQLYTCNEACPKNVDPSYAISDIRQLAINYGIKNSKSKIVRSSYKEMFSSGKIKILSDNSKPIKNQQQIRVICEDLEYRRKNARSKNTQPKNLPAHYKNHEDYASGYFE